MGRKAKPTPERYCEACGKRLERKRLRNGALESLLHFNRRKFCDQKCMAQGFTGRRTSEPTRRTGNHWAATLMAPGPCGRCGKPNASDVHHRNGNTLDNSPENLERVCRSCHMKAHRAAERLHSPERIGLSCRICGKPQKGHGLCDKHYQRWKKWGDPLAAKVNQHTPLAASDD